MPAGDCPGQSTRSATEKDAQTAGVTYTVVDVTENAAALEYVSEDLGYSAAPIVVVDEHNHWAGFRPDRIIALAQGRALEE
ncbi:NrdH-redoxin [Cryobacterium sp. TMS1-13-1]|nr:NrdH-redoxin [Cryobacterium sp. TMS1-13-1]